MKMRLFTLCWSEPYLTWFENALTRSLLWPKNHDAILRFATEWNIYTMEQDRDRLRSIGERVGIPIQFHPFSKQNSSGETLQPCLLDHMRNCQQQGVAAFIAPPDTVFGDGSIGAICEVGSIPNLCIAVPHVRVNAGALGGITEKPMGNSVLVDFAFKNLHKTWVDANATLPHVNSYLGGVSWREIRQGLYAVTHHLPTCYLANVNASDVEWFSRQYETGAWDHSFPVVLVKGGRHRVIASSDAAFIIELTQPFENNPPVYPINPDEPDKFHRDLDHNYVNKNTLTIFRGESAGA